MVALTERLVLSRTRCTALKDVKALNCWGSDLSDISILSEMSNVEVLSLSVNQISSLEAFASCPNLTELYVRKNHINDLSEIMFLRNLTKLKFLWLSDNPCDRHANYRNTVLRTLPQLQKLDNIVVTKDELEFALTHGDDVASSAVESNEAAVPAPTEIEQQTADETGLEITEDEPKQPSPVLDAVLLLLTTLDTPDLKAVVAAVKAEVRRRKGKLSEE